MTDVAVVGAGIVGAAVARHLAEAGATVMLIDRALPASGVTSGSFAWIGRPGGADPADASTPLRELALPAWHRLEAELGDVRIRWTGSLTWGSGPDPGGQPLGPGEHVLDAPEVRELEPALREPPRRALYKADDGALDPVAVTEALVRAAFAAGALTRFAVVVTGMRVRGGRVTGVETSDGFVPAATVVLAAGVDVPVLCALLGVDVPVRPSPAVLMRFAAPPGLVRTVVSCPEVEVRQDGRGHLLVAADHTGEHDQDALRRTALGAVRRLAATFEVDAADVRLVDAGVGARPMPVDGLPVIGPLPGIAGLHLAVMHSAVTLGPAVGALLAAGLARGTSAAELRGLGPARFS